MKVATALPSASKDTTSRPGWLKFTLCSWSAAACCCAARAWSASSAGMDGMLQSTKYTMFIYMEHTIFF